MKEEWKNIKGYEGYYQISNLGNLKALSREVRHPNGGVRKTKERISQGSTDGKGYKVATLSKEGNSERVLIHRLVALAFLKNKYNLPVINHKDGVKHNNKVNNLEWSTYQHNIQHSFNNKLQVVPKGENNKLARFTQEEANFIRAMKLKYNLSNEFLAKVTEVSATTIHFIINGERYND
jgi:hypothetical protein